MSDSETPWTGAHQAPLSMGFPRQEYWSALPCPPPRDLPDPGMEPVSPASPALAGGFFTTEAPRKPVSTNPSAHSSTYPLVHHPPPSLNHPSTSTPTPAHPASQAASSHHSSTHSSNVYHPRTHPPIIHPLIHPSMCSSVHPFIEQISSFHCGPGPIQVLGNWEQADLTSLCPPELPWEVGRDLAR